MGIAPSCALTALVVALLAPVFVFAQERSYEYANIDVDIRVQENASIEVQETQTYDFRGEYHQGYRSIPHKDVSGITDVVVSENGTPLEYSSSRLDKTDPSSWGKYTYYFDEGATVIEWYYDLANKEREERTWTLSYVAHGAVGFYADFDELYWNLFTDYEVPVRKVRAIMRTPGDMVSPRTSFYSEPERDAEAVQTRNDTVEFSTADFPAGSKVTVALGWQKGLVSRSAFWHDWAYLHLGYLASALLILGSLIYGFLHWYFSEVYHKGRGTIIPEYEPPQKLPPAMGQLVATERITTATWPATIVDLAVRGYVKVIKEKRERSTGIGFINRMFAKEGYRVDRIKDYTVDPHVRKFEREFLDLIFADDRLHFSTIDFQKSIQSSPSKSKLFLEKMQAVEKTLYEETTDTTKAYEIPLTVISSWQLRPRAKGSLWLQAVIWIFFLFFFFLDLIPGSIMQYVVFFVACLVSSAGLYLSIKLNPLLNEQGFLLRDDWRGFRMYLKTAEQDRLQKLTPDLFEKFLPYAMVFKLEKEWAHAFDSMNLKQPQWYGTSGYAPGVSFSSSSGVSSGGFSPSVFSASFATSFTSSFSSSGAGGGSGGGGGAGGGGGGGGGGAS